MPKPYTPSIRRIVPVILALLIYLPVTAQIEAKNIDFDNRLEINLEKEIFIKSFENSIHSVNVIDVRDDTLSTGYHYLKGGDAKR